MRELPIYYRISRDSEAIPVWRVNIPRLAYAFDEAVKVACPKTPDKLMEEERARIRAKHEIPLDPLIWSAGDLYKTAPLQVRTINRYLLLFSFACRGYVTLPEALLLADIESKKYLSPHEALHVTHPLEMFAIAANFPTSHMILGRDPVGIIATQEVNYESVGRVCCAWIGSAGREAAFVPSRYPMHSSFWFAFRVDLSFPIGAPGRTFRW